VIEKLTYINERGESLEFSTRSPYHTNIPDCTGLSDIYSQISSAGSAGQDGETLVGNRIKIRDIEIVGHIKDRGKIERLRRHSVLNRILNPHYTASLVYECGAHKRIISCKVEKGPLITRRGVFEQFTIQLLCLNPYWRDEHEKRTDIALWLGMFEFPEPDGLMLCDETGWEIEYRAPSLIENAANTGDVSTGMRVEFRALGQLSNPSVLNVNTMQYIRVNIEMIAGDVLTISTGYGMKAVELTRSGITTNAFRHLDIDSTYLQLEPGDNLIRYDADLNVEKLEVTIYKHNLYLGAYSWL